LFISIRKIVEHQEQSATGKTQELNLKNSRAQIIFMKLCCKQKAGGNDDQELRRISLIHFT